MLPAYSYASWHAGSTAVAGELSLIFWDRRPLDRKLESTTSYPYYMMQVDTMDEIQFTHLASDARPILGWHLAFVVYIVS